MLFSESKLDVSGTGFKGFFWVLLDEAQRIVKLSDLMYDSNIVVNGVKNYLSSEGVFISHKIPLPGYWKQNAFCFDINVTRSEYELSSMLHREDIKEDKIWYDLTCKVEERMMPNLINFLESSKSLEGKNAICFLSDFIEWSGFRDSYPTEIISDFLLRKIRWIKQCKEDKTVQFITLQQVIDNSLPIIPEVIHRAFPSPIKSEAKYNEVLIRYNMMRSLHVDGVSIPRFRESIQFFRRVSIPYCIEIYETGMSALRLKNVEECNDWCSDIIIPFYNNGLLDQTTIATIIGAFVVYNINHQFGQMVSEIRGSRHSFFK